MPDDVQNVSFGDDRLEATLEVEEDHLSLRLRDRATDRSWGPAPLVALESHDRTVRREERFERYRVERCEPFERGVYVVIGHTSLGIVVGLWVMIEGGELVVRFSPPELYERRPEHHRLFAIDVLPGLMEVGSSGTLLLPIGGGALCHPGDKPARADRFLMYMEQPRWELVPLLPVCAAWDRDGGLMAMVTQGDSDGQCRVATDGEGRGSAGFAFSLRRLWPDPLDYETRELRLCPLPPTEDDEDALPRIATRLRSHVTETLGKPTLAERAEQSPAVANALDAITIKLSFAQENEGLEMMHKDKSDPVTYQRGMTFADAERFLTDLREAGVDKAQFFCVGWNPRGHDGLYPTRFPIDERLGGEAGFRRLIAHGRELGHQVSVHDNFMMNIPHAPDWDPECVTHNEYGEPLLHGWWAGGLEYQSWPLAFPRERLDGHLERMADLGVNGIYYCDYMMQPLEVNYHPRHGGPRGDCARGQMKVLRHAAHAFGASACELGTLQGVLAADYVCYASNRPPQQGWPITDLLDRSVPLWELALHGLVIKEKMGIDWPSLMDAVLFGQHPRTQATKHPFRRNLKPFNERFVHAVHAASELVLQRFGHLQTQRITDYREPGDHVKQTTFEDGTIVVADFATNILEVNGQAIPDPLQDTVTA